jgi:hypothetical protein
MYLVFEIRIQVLITVLVCYFAIGDARGHAALIGRYSRISLESEFPTADRCRE